MIALTRRRLVTAAALAWLGLPALASADVEWCYDDPPVLIRLPDGSPVNVNLRVRVPAGRRAQLKATEAAGSVVSDQAGMAIHVTILVPAGSDGSFPVQVTASAGKEHVQVTQAGMAGAALVVVLPLSAA